jgi:hypothetical protein
MMRDESKVRGNRLWPLSSVPTGEGKGLLPRGAGKWRRWWLACGVAGGWPARAAEDGRSTGRCAQTHACKRTKVGGRSEFTRVIAALQAAKLRGLSNPACWAGLRDYGPLGLSRRQPE